MASVLSLVREQSQAAMMPNGLLETVIVGGGPAGSALSILLAQNGRETTLLEKTAAAHDKVCGEFLSGEAIAYLSVLGLDVFSLGAEEIHSVRVASGDRTVEALLPFRAASLSRKRLDEALIDRAQELGVKVGRGRRVHEIEREDDQRWRLQFEDGDPVRAKAVFLATGKHDVRGWVRPRVDPSDLVAFKMHWRLEHKQTKALQAAVEVIFFPGGYGGLQLIEDGVANLCLLIGRRQLKRLNGKWEQVLEMMQISSSHLATRLAGATALWIKPLTLSSIPYGYIRRRSDDVWRLGDQAAVIPSFTGDGISLALHSAHLAASQYLSRSPAGQFQTLYARQVSRPVRAASWISHALNRSLTRPILEVVLSRRPTLLQTAAAMTRIPSRSRLDGKVLR